MTVLFQGVTMGFRKLYAESEFIQSEVEKMESISLVRLTHICEFPVRLEYVKSKYEQPAILAVSLARFAELRNQGQVDTSLFVGHSFGEYAALCASGVMSIEDALFVAERRGELAAQANEDRRGTMAAIEHRTESIDLSHIKDICEAYAIDIAGLNTAKQVVISGDSENIKKACETLKAEGLRVIILDTECAFHSRILTSVQDSFRNFLDEVEFKSPQIPVLMNATADTERDPEKIKDYLAQQLTAPIDFIRISKKLGELSAQGYHEIGTKDILIGFVKQNLQDSSP